MKKRLIKLAVLLLILLVPTLIFTLVSEALPNPYQNTYLGAFEQKYQTLYKTEGKKIVFIGGSGLPFGLRTDLLQEEIGDDYTIVNYGLYATLGTKFMMDTAVDAIKEGDIVILCPELSEQTFSLYFNGEAALQAANGISSSLSSLPIGNQISSFYQYFGYSFDKIGYAMSNTILDPDGVYHADSINAWGDIDYAERENNIMNNGYDVNMTITTDNLLNEDFINYVNDFVTECNQKDAEVYFGFAPANLAAVRSSQNKRAEFEKALKEALDCSLLGSVEDYFLEKGYFYDTNFHLNASGAKAFTHKITLLLKEALGREAVCSIDIPQAPPLASDIVVDIPVSGGDLVPFDKYLGEPNIDYVDYFTYLEEGNTYKIVGVKAEYLGMREVILPSVYNGKNITALAEDALLGCTDLVTIHIGTTYRSLEKGAFNGCISLTGIYLYETDGNRIAPALTGLLDGASRSVKIYIPKDSNYVAGYSWSRYEDKFVTFSKEDNQ